MGCPLKAPLFRVVLLVIDRGMDGAVCHVGMLFNNTSTLTNVVDYLVNSVYIYNIVILIAIIWL